MKKIITSFIKDEEGASLAEYALVLGMIMIVIATVINIFRGDLAGAFVRAGDSFAQ